MLTRILTATLLFTLACPAADWPQWRGPSGNGVSTEKYLPDEWSAAKNIQWKTPIPGIGHSSPIVWGNRIFLTTSLEGPVLDGPGAPVHIRQGQAWKHPQSGGADHRWTLQVLALDAPTGKILWTQTAYEGLVYDNRHQHGSYASPTPATDGKSVFASFGSQGVYAYDLDGRKLWSASVGKMGTLGLGDGTSPVLYNNLVIVQRDEDEGNNSFIVALDKKTGKEIWKTSRHVKVGWSTPVLAGAELIASGNEWITSYDPASGKERWKVEGIQNNAVPSPVFNRDMVIVAAGYPDKRVMAIRLHGSGDGAGNGMGEGSGDGKSADKIAWRYPRGAAYVVSPILYEGSFYQISDKGLLTSINAATGELTYEGVRVPVPAQFTASLVAYEGKILETSEDGETFVIKAGPAHELLHRNELGETVYASPAISGGRIYIRGTKNLYCIANQN